MISDAKARKLSPTDKPLSDSGVKGLYLFSGSTVGAGKWIFRFTSPETRKRPDMGLGRYPEVSVKLAREQAWANRQMVEAGVDPLEERTRQEEQQRVLQEMPTFECAAHTVHADAAPGFRNQKHIDQWINTLVEYVFPKIGKKKVDKISVADFANCLKPIWLEKPETASRVKQRCDKVMKWCVAKVILWRARWVLLTNYCQNNQEYDNALNIIRQFLGVCYQRCIQPRLYPDMPVIRN